MNGHEPHRAVSLETASLPLPDGESRAAPLPCQGLGFFICTMGARSLPAPQALRFSRVYRHVPSPWLHVRLQSPMPTAILTATA